MQQHLTILGVLYIALSAIGLLVAVLVLFGVVGGGLLSGDAQAIAVTSTVGIILTAVIALVCLPGLIGGWGLLRRASWARVLVLILGCINLLNFTFGTALGIYTLWVLTRPEVQNTFS